MTEEKQPEEYALVRSCVAGSPAAQHQLYQQFAPVLFAICKRYAFDSLIAEDMFQESMIRIFQRLNDFRFEGSLEGWMKRICVNQCLDILKKEKLRFSEDIENYSHLPSLASTVESEINAKNLMQLLMELPIGYRTVFNLFAIEGYSHAEIAELLNINENTSKSQLFKARKWLQNQLNRYEG